MKKISKINTNPQGCHTMSNWGFRRVVRNMSMPSKKKQAEKLKSREMKEGRMMNVEGWMMKDDDFKLLRGFVTDRLTD